MHSELAFGFRINKKIRTQLIDDSPSLCEILTQYIDLRLMNHINSNLLSFNIHALIIIDALQNHGKDYESFLTSNRVLDINPQTCILYETNKYSSTIENEYLIRVNIQSSMNIQTDKNYLTIDIHMNKLTFVFHLKNIININ